MATSVKKGQIEDNITYSSLFRNALLNQDPQIWQRGTSITNTTADSYTADRWYVETQTTATDKTVSRQDGTGLNGSYYCARVLAAQDTDELITFSQALESQNSIKFRGQKLTLSFYARGGAEFVSDNQTLVSKIVTGKGTDQKLLAFTTSASAVSQNNTLTTSWVKFTCTTTAAIASDITQIGVSFAFTHAGSGVTTNYFEIAQVQLCAGDVALPFQPKSFEEELRACQRYCVAYGGSETNAGDSYKAIRGVFVGQAAGAAGGIIYFPVQMRAEPTLSVTAGEWRISDFTAAVTLTGLAIAADQGGANACIMDITAASGITQYRPYVLQQLNNATRLMVFSAEL